MKKFMFYTDDGFTQDIDGKDIENCQILGWSSGSCLKEAKINFHNENSYLKNYNYENILSVEIV